MPNGCTVNFVVHQLEPQMEAQLNDLFECKPFAVLEQYFGLIKRNGLFLAFDRVPPMERRSRNEWSCKTSYQNIQLMPGALTQNLKWLRIISSALLLARPTDAAVVRCSCFFEYIVFSPVQATSDALRAASAANRPREREVVLPFCKSTVLLAIAKGFQF